MDDRIRKLYIDQPAWHLAIISDDFLVTIGAKQSNSVYHVVESTPKPRADRIIRYHLKVMLSDLPTALMRDKNQQLIPMVWYSREKKK